ncbi:MAG: peptidoglycan-binding protein, partial [Elainellaceae cyanobacterium]
LAQQRPSSVVLQRGDRGEAVSELQRRLSELGVYSGPVSGFFGELTESAVQEFQRQQGLTVDGIVGGSTTNALRRAPADNVSASSGVLSNGARGEAVTALQRRLQSIGYYDGPITGVYGSLTEDAVRRFQAARGLTVDGIVGTSTADAIDRVSRNASSNNNAGNAGPRPNDGLLEQGETGAEVASLQQRLKGLNYYSGNVDGDFGQLTADAVIRLQRSQGITADGVVGPNTLAAIQRLEQQSGVATNPGSANSAPSPSPAAGSFPSPSQPVTTPPPQVVTPPPPGQTPVFPPASSSGSLPSVQPTSTTSVAFPQVAPQSGPQMTVQQRRTMRVQQELTEQGFYNGPIDGIDGPATQQAIQAAREAYGVNTTDFPGATPF